MKLLDFLFGGNNDTPKKFVNAPVSKAEMQKAQSTAKKLDKLFLTSPALAALDNRNQVMHSRMLSYRSMLAFIYENDYKYGSYKEYIDSAEISHFSLVMTAMLNKAHRDKSVAELSTNWKDVLRVVDALNMAEPARIQPLYQEIKELTAIINKIR